MLLTMPFPPRTINKMSLNRSGFLLKKLLRGGWGKGTWGIVSVVLSVVIWKFHERNTPFCMYVSLEFL